MEATENQLTPPSQTEESQGTPPGGVAAFAPESQAP